MNDIYLLIIILKERLAKGNASQCGFCTPGFVMSLYGLLKINPDPSMHDIEEAFDGNLCRCTGYRPILDSARSFVKKEERDKCCSDSCSKTTASDILVNFDQLKEYDPENDPKFPADLTKFRPNSSVLLGDESSVWLRPSNLGQLLEAKQMWPHARLIGGNSEVGVEMSMRPLHQPTAFVYVGDLIELRDVKITDDGNSLEIGVNITLTELIASLESLKKSSGFVKEHHKSLFTAFLSNLRWFASRHIRNFATLGGNITTGSPISDLNPILVANDATLTVASKERGERSIRMREFFLAYRKIDLAADEIVLKVNVPLPTSKYEVVGAYKQAKRKTDDIALVNGCYRVHLDEKLAIKRLDVSLGGVSAKTIYLDRLAELSRALKWGEKNTLDKIQQALLDEVQIDYSAPGAHPTYRRTLVASFFTRFWHQVTRDLNLSTNNEAYLRNVDEIERSISTSSHDIFSSNHEPHLGSRDPHVAALLHTTGTATYLDDIPKQVDELYAWPVMSTKAHAKLLGIDESRAIALKGVRAFISAKDTIHSNMWGIGGDDEVFASEKVVFHGQIIGVIVADNPSVAKQGAHLVEVKYEELKPIITIDDAIAANSFFGELDPIERGTFDENTFKLDENSDDIIHEGTFEINGQEHFYLETHGCLIIPKRDSDEIEIVASTQDPTAIQHAASEILGVPRNRILSRCKRLGGGFGGKESRSGVITFPCLVAAKKLNKPIRCILDRDIDMIVTGKRHPFKAHYKCRATRDGVIKACDMTLYSNGGHSLDLSDAVMIRALFHIDNAYNIPNLRGIGRIAKTNIASNTA